MDKKLTRIVELHAKLARRIKEYEQAAVNFPPMEVLNELRYALRALLELWEIDKRDEFDEQSFAHAEQKVYHALLCAYHDLVDGIVIDLREAMTEMTEEYPEAARDILGPRIEILDLINEVEEKIAASREKPSERKKIYEEELYDNWFTRLLEYRKQITRTILPEVADKHNLLEEQRRKSNTRNRFMMLVGIMGVLLTIVGIVLTLIALT